MAMDSKTALNASLQDVLESLLTSHQSKLADFASVLSELPGWDPPVRDALLIVAHAPPYYHGSRRGGKPST